MKATRALALVTIVVSDYDEGIAFFVDILGWTLTHDEDHGNGKRWVVVSPGGEGADVLIARAASPTQAASIGRQTGGRVGFFLTTDDFDRDYTAFAAKGLRFIETPRAERYGKVAKFCDPFGNLWDLIERRPNN